MDLRRSCEHGYNTDCQKSRRSDWPLTYLTFMLTTDVHGPCPKITSYPRNPSNLHSVNVGLFSREGVLLFRVSSKMKIRLASEPVLCSLPLSSDFHFATLSAQQNFFPGKYYLSLPMWASYKVLPLQRSSFHCFCIRSTFVGLPLPPSSVSFASRTCTCFTGCTLQFYILCTS